MQLHRQKIASGGEIIAFGRHINYLIDAGQLEYVCMSASLPAKIKFPYLSVKSKRKEAGTRVDGQVEPIVAAEL